MRASILIQRGKSSCLDLVMLAEKVLDFGHLDFIVGSCKDDISHLDGLVAFEIEGMDLDLVEFSLHHVKKES